VELSLSAYIAIFAGSSVVVVFAAIALGKAGDAISSNTGMGHLWVGLILIAGATSLPELVTTITAVQLDNPDLAVSIITGANMLNATKLAIIAGLLGGPFLYQRLSKGQEILSIEALVLTGLAALFITIGWGAAFFGVTLAAVLILAAYLVGSRVLYTANIGDSAPETEEPEHSLRWGWTVYLLAAAAIMVSATALTISADEIAQETGIAASFIGVLAVAFVTTVPELTVGITLMRLGAPEMAVAEFHGSNALNIAILAIADLTYLEGALFEDLDNSNLLAGLFAVVLVGMSALQIKLRRRLKHFSLTEPSTFGFIALYVGGLFLVFQAA
jgi:cation:H+ antiporter